MTIYIPVPVSKELPERSKENRNESDFVFAITEDGDKVDAFYNFKCKKWFFTGLNITHWLKPYEVSEDRLQEFLNSLNK